MLIYFDRHDTSDASRIHVSTDYYVLKTPNINDLTLANSYWQRLGETVEINSMLTDFSLNVGEVGYIYVVKHFSNNDYEEMALEEITDKNFEVLVTHSNIINVELGGVVITNNTLHINGTLDLTFHSIRPRSVTMESIELALYNRANSLLKHYSINDYSISIPTSDLVGYVVGERLYIRYNYVSKNRISSIVSELVIIGYDGLPMITSKTDHIDPEIDYMFTLSSNMEDIKAWKLVSKGKTISSNAVSPTATFTTVINNEHLEYDEHYMIRLTLEIEDGDITREYDVSYPIRTIPKRESYDINTSYTYTNLVKSNDLVIEDDLVLYSEELTVGKLIGVHNLSVIERDINLVLTGVGDSNAMGDIEPFSNTNGIKVLVVDNYRFCIIDDNNIYVYKYNHRLNRIDKMIAIPKPNNTLAYTISYNSGKLLAIVSGTLVSIDLTTGDITSLKEVPGSNDLTSITYMGYGRTYIVGGMEQTYIYNDDTMYLDLVDTLPIDERTNELVVSLGMDGNPIVISKVTGKVFRFIVKTDIFEAVVNGSVINEAINRVIRYRDGKFVIIDVNDAIYTYS